VLPSIKGLELTQLSREAVYTPDVGGGGGGGEVKGKSSGTPHDKRCRTALRPRQQCLFSIGGYVGPRSPDHADAAIWGLTELMLETAPGAALFEYYDGLQAEQAA
jgi:hypothetical protein